jgi:8-oxo-dGTP diphosphatase
MLKKEILHHAEQISSGNCLLRQAVRAIILKNQDVLMIYSDINGDYKFPGGGIEAGETHAEALNREISEECGARITSIGKVYAEMIEIFQTEASAMDISRMVSTYYFCKISNQLGAQNLDLYEEELGFRPVWVSIGEAISTNRAVLQRQSPPAPRWTRRDLYVLEQLADKK